MANVTAIEWTDLSWNNIHGCSIVSTECRHCYAMELSLRYGQTNKPWTPANASENVLLKPHKMRDPFTDRKEWRGLGDAAARAGKKDGQMVFVNSMSDLFHEQVPLWYLARTFAVMAIAERHTFQILTKRAPRMREILTSPQWPGLVRTQAHELVAEGRQPAWVSARVAEWDSFVEWPLPNVWLGVSCGLRHFVGRADDLRATPATIRFISAEPLLGPLMADSYTPPDGWPTAEHLEQAARTGDEPLAIFPPGAGIPHWDDGYRGPDLNLESIDWLIAGGESGSNARPCETDWLRALRDACEWSGTFFFLKQLGGRGDKRGKEKAVLDGERYLAMPQVKPTAAALTLL